MFIELGMYTPELRQAVIDEPFKTLSKPMFRKVIEAEPVSADNPFRAKPGRQCEQCRRLTRCTVGQEFVEHERAIRAEREASRFPVAVQQPATVEPTAEAAPTEATPMATTPVN